LLWPITSGTFITGDENDMGFRLETTNDTKKVFFNDIDITNFVIDVRLPVLNNSTGVSPILATMTVVFDKMSVNLEA
jgi:hypothetical protein